MTTEKTMSPEDAKTALDKARATYNEAADVFNAALNVLTRADAAYWSALDAYEEARMKKGDKQ
jgi:CelD/BcsL family acetyltransferase involved in cellulose biosynthesis